MIIDKLIEPISDILDKLIPDKDLKYKLQHELNQELHKANIAQLEVNKVEAGHSSLFVSGWRPFIGWTCGLGMFGNFITIPFANFVLALVSIDIVIPLVPLETMMPVLMGMLGLGAMRSFEKTRK